MPASLGRVGAPGGSHPRKSASGGNLHGDPVGVVQVVVPTDQWQDRVQHRPGARAVVTMQGAVTGPRAALEARAVITPEGRGSGGDPFL